jgi:uncharacterized membrane protein
MIYVARALHVLGVLWWIGGVVTVTATFVPTLLRSRLTAAERSETFRQIRRRFAWQARVAVIVVGASGAYLLTYLDGFARLASPLGRPIDLMIATWSVFFLILFVLEPLGAGQKLGLTRRPRVFMVSHVVLSALALVTVACAVVGAHGGLF